MTGPYAFFIAASYGISAFCLTALVGWVFVQHTQRKRRLMTLKETLDHATKEAGA